MSARTSQEVPRRQRRRMWYRRWSWLGHVLRMPEHRLVRQVLLNCVKPTQETLFADVPNLSIEKPTKMSKDREAME